MIRSHSSNIRSNQFLSRARTHLSIAYVAGYCRLLHTLRAAPKIVA